MLKSAALMLALAFPLLVAVPSQAQNAKAKAAAPKAAKAEKKTKVAPAKPAPQKAAAAPADAKAQKPAKPAKPGMMKKADAKKANDDATADAAEKAPCKCMMHVAKLEKMLAFHTAAVDVYKKDPVLKVKDFKGKAKAAYKRRAKAEKAFHRGMAKLLKKKIAFFKKESKKCAMPKLMSEAPQEVKQILKDRKEMLQAKRKAAMPSM